jgi:predicted RNA-binding Zn ribbon-like protein
MNDKQFSSYADAPPKLLAGVPGIDFLNTVEWRGDPSRTAERLTSYRELVIWCLRADLLTGAESRQLTAEAARHPQAAARAVRTAIDLREAAVELLQSPLSDSAAVAQLNRCLTAAPFEYRIKRTDGGRLRSLVTPIGKLLSLPFYRVAQEIVTVLTSDPPEKIRSCTNKRCGWFFVDTSRNNARRWCQMTTCGNQAKARAHYARRRQSAM